MAVSHLGQLSKFSYVSTGDCGAKNMRPLFLEEKAVLWYFLLSKLIKVSLWPSGLSGLCKRPTSSKLRRILGPLGSLLFSLNSEPSELLDSVDFGLVESAVFDLAKWVDDFGSDLFRLRRLVNKLRTLLLLDVGEWLSEFRLWGSVDRFWSRLKPCANCSSPNWLDSMCDWLSSHICRSSSCLSSDCCSFCSWSWACGVF
ncbi:hypothetical protein BpHYR1_046237 [Brachionus plicatilis]|uniref:Uncharacterized protein n=1 Tax=Brachionus plicatilis TaxID=10195 RepID=A0A3M7PGL4_BRAPC|nr:hypothetical protein BpHYR1_046237 [Brachionus plicatilis]